MAKKSERIASPLDEVIAGLKSAVVIDDPEEIGKVLSERHEAARKAKPSLRHFVRREKSGEARVYKATGVGDPTGMLGDGAPTVEATTFPELAKARGLEWQDEYRGRVIPYWCSDERPDSQGDIVRQIWLFDLFEKNPVWPISHDWGGLPVANGIDWQVLMRRAPDYTGPALWMLGLFATKDQYEFADKVFRLAKAGFLRAGSVGFASDRVIDVKDEGERAQLGLGRYGVILEENHLLEFSPCTLGANPGAHSLLSMAKQRGELQAVDLEVAREIERAAQRRSKDESGWKKTDNDLTAMARLLFPRTKFRGHREIEAPFEEFEQGTLRGYVPPEEPKAADGEIERLERKIDELKSAMADGMLGISTMLEDLKDLVGNGNLDEAPDLDADDDGTKAARPKSFLEIIRKRDVTSGVVASG